MKVHTIVVGFDGSENARKALDAAIEFVEPNGTIHVVTAYEMPAPTEMQQLRTTMPDEFVTNVDLLEGSRGHLRDAEMILGARGVDHKGHFLERKPAVAILDIADQMNADLIVVGSRGLGRVKRFLRGSVSTRIASHATTSFMVIVD